MTMALCFSCGHVKFGAICPCSVCQISSTGNMELDILFSDHNMAESTLEQFGSVVKLINSNVEDKPVRFWTFLYYISERHSDLMSATPPSDIADQVKRLYDRLEFPPVEFRPGRHGCEFGSQSETPPSAENVSGQKRWWQFWKQERGE